MRWRDRQQEIKNCEIVIYYNDSKLYPLSEWLHPGALPIGTGLKDDIRQDLPNLDWIIRHVVWLGFRKILVVSHENFKGLDRFYNNFLRDINIKFTNLHFSEVLKQNLEDKFEHIIFLSGLIPSNSNLRHAFMLHQQRENLASLLSIRGFQFRVGIAEVDDETNVVNFKEKPIDKSMLVNSNILIIDIKRLKVIKESMKAFIEAIDGHGYSIEEIIRESIRFFISNKLLKSVELTGVSGDPWFMDLSQLENWVKLDHDRFIEKFSHLYTSD